MKYSIQDTSGEVECIFDVPEPDPPALPLTPDELVSGLKTVLSDIEQAGAIKPVLLPIGTASGELIDVDRVSIAFHDGARVDMADVQMVHDGVKSAVNFIVEMRSIGAA